MKTIRPVSYTHLENAFGLGDRKGNKGLRWEMTSEWNYGIDFGFLNNRINGTIDVYNRTTKDLIFARSVGCLLYTSVR